MRFGLQIAFAGLVAMTSGLHIGCSSDGTLVDLPNARDGLNGGSGNGYGSPNERADRADASADLDGAASATGDGSSATPVRAPITTTPGEPITTADAAAGETDAAVAPDAAAAAEIAGCACGCADPCLTQLIVSCKTPSSLLAVVCAKVPATCACETTCTPAPPAPPSLDTCVAQFLLTGT